MTHSDGELSTPVPDTDVTSFVFERAEERASRTAIVDGPSDRALTYAELETGVRALAAGLAARGLGPDDSLGVFMPNLPEYAIAFHGAASAGSRCTTANPLYTAGELAHQLGDAQARLLLTVAPFLDTATKAAQQAGIEEVFVLGEAVEGASPLSDLLGDPGDAPRPEIDPATDLAVLPYSSGTTGLPKGVMLTHRNLVANMCQTQERLGLDDRSVLVGVLPFFHIYGQTVIMNLGLRQGAKLVTMPRFDLEQFLDLIESHRVTHVFVVPPIALALAKHPAVEGRDLSSIEVVMSGAAPLGAELSELVSKRLGCVVMQGYGLTETSPVTHVVPPVRERNRPGSIGPPLPATECRIVDFDTGQDVDDGEAGELWIRGPQVMSGYLGNPEATAQTIDEDGWLHTGDIAVRDSDGYFEIVDRLKELIKYKGFQVPPAELEALLLTHPVVADAAVIGVPDDEAGELPKAFVVADADLDSDELIAWVADRVAPQKRIRLVEEVKEIPKSPSGKILRRELRDRV